MPTGPSSVAEQSGPRSLQPPSPVETAGRVAGRVAGVAASATHSFSKDLQPVIRLVAGLGVAGDAHAGATVQHRSRLARHASEPNLRQVHLIQAELFDRLAALGHRVRPGELGENVTTAGLDLHAMSVGTVLRLGADAEVELTGSRNPCWQIDRFQPGLLRHVLRRDAAGRLVRTAGVMAVVRRSGDVRAGDPVTVVPPAGPHRALDRV